MGTVKVGDMILEDRAYSIPELATLLGIPQDALYDSYRRAEITTIRIGKRIFIPFNQVVELIMPKGQKSESSNEWLDPQSGRWNEIIDETPGIIRKKWRTRYHGRAITVFESDHGHGWTFVVDGLKPMKEVNDNRGNTRIVRMFLDSLEDAIHASITYADNLN